MFGRRGGAWVRCCDLGFAVHLAAIAGLGQLGFLGGAGALLGVLDRQRPACAPGPGRSPRTGPAPAGRPPHPRRRLRPRCPAPARRSAPAPTARRAAALPKASWSSRLSLSASIRLLARSSIQGRQASTIGRGALRRLDAEHPLADDQGQRFVERGASRARSGTAARPSNLASVLRREIGCDALHARGADRLDTHPLDRLEHRARHARRRARAWHAAPDCGRRPSAPANRHGRAGSQLPSSRASARAAAARRVVPFRPAARSRTTTCNSSSPAIARVAAVSACLNGWPGSLLRLGGVAMTPYPIGSTAGAIAGRLIRPDHGMPDAGDIDRARGIGDAALERQEIALQPRMRLDAGHRQDKIVAVPAGMAFLKRK